jgi:hypothetical protein
MLDPLEPVLRRLLKDTPEINAPRVAEVLRDTIARDSSHRAFRLLVLAWGHQ